MEGNINNANTQLANKQEGCKTYIEQVKLLVTLASTFVVAPAVFHGASNLKLDYFFTIAEVGFIFSVICGYVGLGAVSGSQYKGEYNVFDPLMMWAGKTQFFSFLLGLVLFMFWFNSNDFRNDTSKEQKESNTNHVIINQ